MSSKLKWIGIAIVAIFLILVVLPFLIPVNKFKPTIESKASDALGRKVQLGDLSLSLLTGSVGIDNVSVSDDPKFNSGPFLTAKSVKVGVGLSRLVMRTKRRLLRPSFSSTNHSGAPGAAPCVTAGARLKSWGRRRSTRYTVMVLGSWSRTEDLSMVMTWTCWKPPLEKEIMLTVKT